LGSRGEEEQAPKGWRKKKKKEEMLCRVSLREGKGGGGHPIDLGKNDGEKSSTCKEEGIIEEEGEGRRKKMGSLSGRSY